MQRFPDQARRPRPATSGDRGRHRVTTARRTTILVVEDNADEALVLRMRLEAEGYGVLTVDTGSDALHLLGSGLCDMAILDVNLPDIHGFELCRRIRHWEMQ